MEVESRALTWCLGERYLIGTAPGSRKRGEGVRERGGDAQQLRLAWGRNNSAWTRGWRRTWSEQTLAESSISGMSEGAGTTMYKRSCCGSCRTAVMALSRYQYQSGSSAATCFPHLRPCLTTQQTTSRACQDAATSSNIDAAPLIAFSSWELERCLLTRLHNPGQVSRSLLPRRRSCIMQGLDQQPLCVRPERYPPVWAHTTCTDVRATSQAPIPTATGEIYALLAGLRLLASILEILYELAMRSRPVRLALALDCAYK